MLYDDLRKRNNDIDIDRACLNSIPFYDNASGIFRTQGFLNDILRDDIFSECSARFGFVI
jgi:hypothetical protein